MYAIRSLKLYQELENILYGASNDQIISFFSEYKETFSSEKAFANVYDFEMQVLIISIIKKNIGMLKDVPKFVKTLTMQEKNSLRQAIGLINLKHKTVASLLLERVILQDKIYEYYPDSANNYNIWNKVHIVQLELPQTNCVDSKQQYQL